MLRFLVALLLTLSASLVQAEAKVAVFAGGCFWCMEPPYDKLDGVISTISGYTGGHTENPTYKQTSTGTTGHYEALQVTYDSTKVTYETLLDVFWKNIDPFNDTGQFCDRGPQYLSAIFYLDEEQKEIAEISKQSLQQKFTAKNKIVTPILPASMFYEAEEYHQNYYKKNPLRYKYYRFSCGRDDRLQEVQALLKTAY